MKDEDDKYVSEERRKGLSRVTARVGSRWRKNAARTGRSRVVFRGEEPDEVGKKALDKRGNKHYGGDNTFVNKNRGVIQAFGYYERGRCARRDVGAGE